MVATSCSNPRAHKAEVHYQRGTLVESRPCWQVVSFPSQSPSFLTQAQPNPAKPLPFLPQAQTNTILILNPSSNPLYLVPSISPTYSPLRKVAKQMRYLLCLRFYDAFSDHACVFLCVRMHLEAELPTPQETPTQCIMATHDWISSTHSHLHSGPAPTCTPLHGSEV